MLPLLYTRQDTAKLLNVSTRTLDRLNLPKVKLGRSTRYEIKDVEAYITNQRKEPIVSPKRPHHSVGPSVRAKPQKKQSSDDWAAAKRAQLQIF